MSIFAAAPAFPSNPYPAKPMADLQLAAGSAAVDKGVALAGVNDGFTGLAPDLGAYEVGIAPPTYGPRTSDGTGGTTGSGGASGTGGVPGTGGAAGVGGAVSTGGKVGTGGAVSTGGALGSGGAVSTGGKVGMGGAVSTGGAVGGGGAVATGGAVGTGGAVSTGGAVGTGGAVATGGAVETGGAVSSGGATTAKSSGCSCSTHGPAERGESTLWALLSAMGLLHCGRLGRSRRSARW